MIYLYHGSNVEIDTSDLGKTRPYKDFGRFSGGLIGAEVLVEAMKFKKLTNQYSFHSVKALLLLERTGGYHG